MNTPHEVWCWKRDYFQAWAATNPLVIEDITPIRYLLASITCGECQFAGDITGNCPHDLGFRGIDFTKVPACMAFQSKVSK